MCSASRPVATPTQVAAAQIWELVERLPANGPVPLFVFDAGYDPEALARELAELDGQQVAVLVRLRSDRCFYADPPPADGAKVGRPRRHGQKFTCAEERTWWTPTSEHCEEHTQYGSVRVSGAEPRLPRPGPAFWHGCLACQAIPTQG
jgi:DDE superfamily endonuclease